MIMYAAKTKSNFTDFNELKKFLQQCVRVYKLEIF